jgi:hypothetical protein
VKKRILKKKYLAPYEKLLKKVRPKLDLKRPIKLKLASGWYFHIPSKGRSYMLYCPPYRPSSEPAFVHYLCHAKLLEDGWKRPEIKIFRKKSKYLFGWINRSADSFFDFYTWKLVADKLGKSYFLRFTKRIVAHKPQEVIRSFRYFYTKQKEKFTAYTVCLDWFAMFYVLSWKIDKKRYRAFVNLYKQLIPDKEFRKFVPAGIKQRMVWLRKFYTSLIKKYPTYRELLKDGNAAQREFIRYYSQVWRGTNLKVKITKFVY